MNVLDTSSWKKFKISDLFNCEKGQISSFKDMNEGTTAIVSASLHNNGVVGYYDCEARWKNKITVTASGQPGVAFYHQESFNANSNVNVLIEKFEMNKYIALFICTLITKNSIQYSYSNVCGKEKLLVQTIKLPVDNEGNPNWNYMTEFMKDIERRSVFIQHLRK